MAPTSSMEAKCEREGGDITYLHMVDEKPPVDSEIQKLFAGSTVFLTGGTGFLGKLMLDRLIRCCPGLKKVYVLARAKKNKDIQKRLEEQFEDVLYEKMRKQVPNFMEKIGIIEGDVGQLGLGISDENRKTLTEEVDIIIHGAATVRFDEALKTAVEINVRGTREILLLAKACHKLKSLVHISTAYSNCTRDVIEEKFYEPPLAADRLIELVDTLDEKTLSNITPGILGDFPNTYAYTKSAAEDIVQQYSKGLPVAMLRPAIVIATVKEPVAGWIDNVYGPTGVVVGAAVGLLHALNADPSALADLVPGDMVVSAVLGAALAAAARAPANRELDPPNDCPTVYNYVSSEEKPLTWDKFMYYNEVYGLEVPTMQAIYYYMFMLIKSKFLYKVNSFFFHWIPAYIVDGLAVLIGRKPILRKAYTKIEKFSEVISYFSTREWKFSNQNTQKLFKDLNEADQQMFDFNMSGLDWADYFKTHIKGIRIYLLKDPLDTVPQGLSKHYKLKCAHYLAVTVISLLLLRLLWGILMTIYGVFV